MLARALQHDVPHLTRVKGADYHRRGAVRDIARSDRGVTAIVRGTFDYAVAVEHEAGGFIGSCECPFFIDRGEVCKHIWAVLLSSEAEAALAASGPIPRQAWIDPLVQVPDDFAPESATIQPPAGRAPAAWEHFLTEVQRNADVSNGSEPDLRRRDSQLVYVVHAATSPPHKQQWVELSIQSRSRKKDGDWTRPRALSFSRQDIDDLATDEDVEVLRLLRGANRSWSESAVYGGYPHQPHLYTLEGPWQQRLLPLVVRTGRAYVAPGPRDSALLPVGMDEGSPWRFELSVAPVSGNGFRVEGILTRGDERMPVSEPVLVVEDFLFTRTAMARLDATGAFPWLAQLRRSGAVTVPPGGTARLAETIARSGLRPDRLPDPLRFEIVEPPPRPSVLIRRQRSPAGGRENLDATVQFDYDGIIPGVESSTYDAARRRLVRRDRAAEQRAYDRLAELGFTRMWNPREGRQTLGVAADRFPRAVRTLVQEGWRVEAEGRVFRAPRAMQLEVRSGIDWFELHGRVEFGDGVAVSLPTLFAAFERGDGTVTLDDGTKGLVPEDWLGRFAGIVSFGEAEGDHVRYRRAQASLLDALLASQPAVAVDEVFARARTALQTFSGIGALDPPDSFVGRLREYQREALGWLEFLRRFGFGGCLADDMGLGKTVMVLAMLESRRRTVDTKDHRPSLAVVPRSLVFNWIEEAGRFAPGLRLLDYTGAARAGELVERHDLVLTTYGTLRRDAAQLKDVEFDYVILDEAQAIKNAATASAKAARLLRGRHRLALSGTPIENHVGELWSLFEFLNPGLLGTAAAFQRGAGRARGDREELALLSRAVRPFILRRTKQQVAPELPERTEQTIHCELDDAQRALYNELRDRYRRTLLAQIDREGLHRSRMQVLEALLRLRQAACHAALVDARHAGDSSGKFDVLLPRLAELVEEGHKTLVFSQFTTLLGLLRPRLEAAGISYEYLDGRTRDRAARVERFQTDPDCRVFLVSLKAGGVGLNLTAAEYVFLLDPWWNPAAEAQAIDRAHRIGQMRHVFAYRLIARDTVEEKVAELQDTKRGLADAILTADASLIRTLSREDLEWLVG